MKKKLVNVRGHKRKQNGKHVKVKGYKKVLNKKEVKKLFGWRNGVNTYVGEGSNHITAQVDNKEFNFSKTSPEERLLTVPARLLGDKKTFNDKQIGEMNDLRLISSGNRTRYVQKEPNCVELTMNTLSECGLDTKAANRGIQLTEILNEKHKKGDRGGMEEIIRENRDVKFYNNKIFSDLGINVDKIQDEDKAEMGFFGFFRKNNNRKFYNKNK